MWQIRIYKRDRNLCEAHGCFRNDGCGGGGESGKPRKAMNGFASGARNSVEKRQIISKEGSGK